MINEPVDFIDDALILWFAGVAGSMYVIKGINLYKELTKQRPPEKCPDGFCAFGRSHRKDPIYLLLPFPLDYAYVYSEYQKKQKENNP